MLSSVLMIVYIVILAYAGVAVLYLFLLSAAARFTPGKGKKVRENPLTKIAVLVPAYKEDFIIASTAASLKNLDYPSHLYTVFILADSFQQKTIETLKQLPVEVIEVSFDKSTKTKSLNEFFKREKTPYDVAVICDADNILAKDFLKQMDAAYAGGCPAMQGRRVAKNADSSFAVLDGCSEAINNNLFRRGANALGLSSSVIGSGMAFDFPLIKRVLLEIDAVSGFDKELQLKIVEEGFTIQYLENALIFDEKVGSADAFKTQRQRWIFSQLTYLKKYFVNGCIQLLKGNLSYFNLAVVSALIPPRAFMLVLFPLLVATGYFAGHAYLLVSLVFFLCYMFTLVLALPSEMINRHLLNALVQLPRAIFAMFSSLAGAGKARHVFLHTAHTKTEVSNPLFDTHGK